jgi:3-hydroxyisobutyrate dehydrogenase-like beta-hydroxyacid dehydrogenase
LKRIGLIGCGIVGHALGTRLLSAGWELQVHDRHRAKADSLVLEGATWCASPRELAEGCDTLLSALPHPEDVLQALLGEEGAWPAAPARTVHVDTSTVGLECARTLAGEARARGLRYLDAPLSAAEPHPSGQRLTLFASGNADHFAAAGPLLRVLADHVHYVGGPPGKGQVVKLVNNLVTDALTVILGDALALGLKCGIPIELLHATLHDGTAQSRLLDDLLPISVFRGDWRPGLRLDLALKDLGLAQALAGETGVEQGLLEAVRTRFERARARGWGDLSADVVLRLVEESAGVSYVSPIFQRAQETPDL